MREVGPTDEALARALVAAGRELDFPPTPALASVSARLEIDAATGRRPAFPRMATWSRRRALVLAVAGAVALSAVAFGARFVLGAAEVRVRPDATPSAAPLDPDRLGRPVPLARIASVVGFPVGLPAGPPPSAAYEVRTDGATSALLVWEPSPRYPAVPGTSWGLALLVTDADDEIIVKDVNRYDDLTEVSVGGLRAAWIDAPHQLIVATEAGPATFSVRANVLIWTDGDLTYRLETSLGRRAAIAIAESVR